MVFLALMVPSGLVVCAGIVPIYALLLHFFPWLTLPTANDGRQTISWLLRWERRCAVAWGRQVRYELRRLEGTSKSADGGQKT